MLANTPQVLGKGALREWIGTVFEVTSVFSCPFPSTKGCVWALVFRGLTQRTMAPSAPGDQDMVALSSVDPSNEHSRKCCQEFEGAESVVKGTCRCPNLDACCF